MKLVLKTIDKGIGMYSYGYSTFQSYKDYDINIKGKDFKFYLNTQGTQFFQETVKIIEKDWFGLVEKIYYYPVILFSVSYNILGLKNSIESVTASVEVAYQNYLEEQKIINKRREEIENNKFILQK